MNNDSNTTSQTVCRAFAFINYNIPPDPSEDKNLKGKEKYTTVGFFDAMETEQLHDLSLCEMWKKNETYALELDGKYSFQSIFGIRKDNSNIEKLFWEVDEERPLSFFTFLQMQETSFPADSFSSNSFELLEDCLHESIRMYGDRSKNIRIEGISYLTLDKNDFIVGIKTNRYDIVSNLLLDIHQRMAEKKHPILYSYSIYLINRKLFEKDLHQARWVKNLEEQNEIIDTVCFKGIGNTHSPGNLQDKYREYTHNLQKCLYLNTEESEIKNSHLYDIIGDYDFQFIANNVPLINLLYAMSPEYPNQAGPLHYGSNILRNTLYASILVLNSNGSSLKGMTTSDNFGKCSPSSDAYRCQQLRNILIKGAQEKRIFIEANPSMETNSSFCLRDFYEDAVESTTIGSLSKLIGSLAALERAPTRKYDFETLYWPCRSLIEILFNKESTCVNRWEDLPFLSRFINALSSTLHGTLRTDIQFFQINDFNAIVHYAPAKLRAFYSAWVYKLTKYYQCFSYDNESKKYEFIIVPSNSPSLITQELTCTPRPRENKFSNDFGDSWMTDSVPIKIKDTDYRLMYVEMPEHLLYQPEYSCIILAHEIAHFGGGVAKKRKCSNYSRFGFNNDRFTVLLRCVSSWYAVTCHTLLICELNDRAKDGSQNAILLRNLVICYLDSFKEKGQYDIKKTIIYQSIFKYLQQNAIPTSAYVSECEILLKSVLWRFVQDKIDGMSFSQANTAYREMELSVRKWLHIIDKDCKLKERIEKGIPVCWTETLNMELMQLLHDVSQDVENSMRSLIISCLQGHSVRIVHRILKIIQESQADLIGILSLGLSPKQYYDSLMKSNTLVKDYGWNEGVNEDLRDLLSQYIYIRILMPTLAMRYLAKENRNNHYSSSTWTGQKWDEWMHLKWSVMPNPVTDDSVSIVCAKLNCLCNTTPIDDRAFFRVKQDRSSSDLSGFIDMCQDIIFANKEIQYQVVHYLVGCGQELLHGSPESQKLADDLRTVFKKIASAENGGPDIYDQAKAIDLELLIFEREQIKRFEKDKQKSVI